MPGRARSPGCSPRSTRSSRRSSSSTIATLLERDKSWYDERLPMLEDRVRDRLDELSARLGDAEWLDGEFSAGDLMMVTVLRRLDGTGHPRGLSDPLRLCRPRRSAARLSARLCRPAGGVHGERKRQADRPSLRDEFRRPAKGQGED